jgi:hypothetical protein
MLSAGCFFRGNWMGRAKARTLVARSCEAPDLCPECWNTYEPVNRRFDPNDLDGCADALTAAPGNLGASVLFSRKKKPRWGSIISLWKKALHNDFYCGVHDPWPTGAVKLQVLVEQCVRATAADYAYVSDSVKADEDRFAELRRPYTTEELRRGIRRAPPFISGPGIKGVKFNPIKEKMYGPSGYLWDIVWYNYFGPPYVELIGWDRLRGAGWAIVEELAGGLACFVTRTIDDPCLSEKREGIRRVLGEFVWTPGCKREEKLAPVFDFSAQVAGVNSKDNKQPIIVTAGLTKEEERKAIKLLKGKVEEDL